MKKLMIAAFAIAFAAVAQAASINWSSYWATDSEGLDLSDGSQAYLLTTAYAIADATADLSAGKFDASKVIASSITEFDANNGSSVVMSGIATTLTGDQEFYMILLNGVADKADAFMIVDPIIVSIKSVGPTVVGFQELSDEEGNSLYAWQPITGGQAIPEPTSALMLLVGLAGLALKRKVA